MMVPKTLLPSTATPSGHTDCSMASSITHAFLSPLLSQAAIMVLLCSAHFLFMSDTYASPYMILFCCYVYHRINALDTYGFFRILLDKARSLAIMVLLCYAHYLLMSETYASLSRLLPDLVLYCYVPHLMITSDNHVYRPNLSSQVDTHKWKGKTLVVTKIDFGYSRGRPVVWANPKFYADVHQPDQSTSVIDILAAYSFARSRFRGEGMDVEQERRLEDYCKIILEEVNCLESRLFRQWRDTCMSAKDARLLGYWATCRIIKALDAKKVRINTWTGNLLWAAVNQPGKKVQLRGIGGEEKLYQREFDMMKDELDIEIVE